MEREDDDFGSLHEDSIDVGLHATNRLDLNVEQDSHSPKVVYANDTQSNPPSMGADSKDSVLEVRVRVGYAHGKYMTKKMRMGLCMLGGIFWIIMVFSRMTREREKWAVVYGRNTFFVDRKGSQLVESLFHDLRNYLYSDLDVLDFVKYFERVVEQCYKEIEANDEMNRCMPRLMGNVILLKHASDVYTPNAFDICTTWSVMRHS